MNMGALVTDVCLVDINGSALLCIDAFSVLMLSPSLSLFIAALALGTYRTALPSVVGKCCALNSGVLSAYSGVTL